MDPGQDGFIARMLIDVDLDIEHLHVVSLESGIPSFGGLDNAHMVHQVHPQLPAFGCGGDAIGIVAVVVASAIDGGQNPGVLQQTVEGADVFEDHAHRVSDIVEE